MTYTERKCWRECEELYVYSFGSLPTFCLSFNLKHLGKPWSISWQLHNCFIVMLSSLRGFTRDLLEKRKPKVCFSRSPNRLFSHHYSGKTTRVKSGKSTKEIPQAIFFLLFLEIADKIAAKTDAQIISAGTTLIQIAVIKSTNRIISLTSAFINFPILHCH